MTDQEFKQLVLEKLGKLEEGQKTILEHVVRLSEDAQGMKKDLTTIKEELAFHTHKIGQTEKEIFILKNR